jgi:hypothetical protein
LLQFVVGVFETRGRMGFGALALALVGGIAIPWLVS